MDVDRFIILIDKYRGPIKQHLEEIGLFQLNEYESFLRKILIRFYSTITAVRAVLIELKNDPQIYTPVALLLRSINTDYLTILYLETFAQQDTDYQIACLNELKILDRDYVRFLRKFSSIELEFVETNNQSWEKYINNLKLAVKNHHTEYDTFYTKSKGGPLLIKNESIREKTPDQFFKAPKDKTKSFSEEEKHERLKNYKLAKWATQAFLAFKFYSQYQHVSPLFLNLRNDQQRVVSTMFFNFTMENIIIGSQIILSRIYKPNKKIKSELKAILDECEKLMIK